MANLTIRNIDRRVADRLVIFAAKNSCRSLDAARDVLSHAVGIEPKSGLPPPPKGHPTPWVREGKEPPKFRPKCLTVRDIPPRVMRRIEAAAKKNKRTTSAEARTLLTEAIGYNRPLRKGEESAHEFLIRAMAPIRDLYLAAEARKKRKGSSKRRNS